MTDITELALRLKLEAHRAVSNFNPQMNIKTRDLKELVEALEYYKSREERVTSLVRDNSKSWDELYRQVEAKGKRNVELVEALASEKRICATWRKTAEANSEKLEKAQQVDEELCKLLPPGAEYMDPPDGGDVTPLEGVRRMVVDYRQRIAELESRTVKLPEPFELAKSSSGLTYYYADEVDAALTAAGIKVEAE
ncbi:ead/Ea22-like family protein [Klebsiella pneumoniae]